LAVLVMGKISKMLFSSSWIWRKSVFICYARPDTQILYTSTIFLRTGEAFKPQLIPSLMWWERTME
jgi:hypothetical protein